MQLVVNQDILCFLLSSVEIYTWPNEKSWYFYYLHMMFLAVFLLFLLYYPYLMHRQLIMRRLFLMCWCCFEEACFVIVWCVFGSWLVKLSSLMVGILLCFLGD